MKKYLALLLLPALLTAAQAAPAADADSKFRFVNIVDMAKLGGMLHRDAAICGEPQDGLLSPEGRIQTLALAALKKTAPKIGLDWDEARLRETLQRAYTEGANADSLFIENGKCTPDAKQKINRTGLWLQQQMQDMAK
ncbi:MAG: hypothetical protein Q3966_06240 [Neisseria sp.]|nr:hypothetical protein [Neisseria sp.]